MRGKSFSSVLYEVLCSFFIITVSMLFFPFFFQINTKNDEITQLNCFLHYYSRFKNHENSYKVRT